MVTEITRPQDRLKQVSQKDYPVIVLLAGIVLFILFNTPFQYLALLAALVCVAVSGNRRRQRSPLYARYQLIAVSVVLLLLVFYEVTPPVYFD
ncbi:hypothetical protein CH299_29225 [Rhodococcus sp. 14-2686-1-2]|nr:MULTISPECIES: hypothetical protein [unclassified Rhodococcus (in: high G+C Gram-positive bacteria)]OZE90741.1 hypothetical protein CH301_29350 [Rhodococcus sp. 15-1189-1-1a]OZF07722.1 hypothetical protein CH299_29225 [Rhodococcus sp. 14-2686-1-2]